MGRLSVKEVMAGVREEQDKLKTEKEIREKENKENAEKEEKTKKYSYEEEGFEFEDVNADEAEETPEEKAREAEERLIKRNRILQILTFGVGGLLVLTGLVFIVLLNTPDRRFTRNFNRAEKYFSETRYSEAVGFYKKALKADKESGECYLGILCAEEALESEGLKETFEEGLAFFESLPEEKRIENKDLIVEYDLHEATVYANDGNLRQRSLRKGIEMLGGNEDLERLLKEDVYAYVDKEVEKGKFGFAIERLQYYLDIPSMEAEAKIAEVEQEEIIYNTKVEVLTAAYETLKDYYSKYMGDAGHDPFTYNFDGLLKLDGSRNAEKLVQSETAEAYSYNPEAGDENTVSLVTFGRKYRNEKGEYTWPYYFTIGNTGKGNAVSFMRTGETSFVLFEGEWENGLPEGQGTKYVADLDNGTLAYYKGTWHEGLAEGEIDVTLSTVEWENVTFTGKINALKGVGETVPTETEDYVIQNLRSENLIAVLESDSDGYALCYAMWQKSVSKIDAIGMY